MAKQENKVRIAGAMINIDALKEAKHTKASLAATGIYDNVPEGEKRDAAYEAVWAAIHDREPSAKIADTVAIEASDPNKIGTPVTGPTGQIIDTANQPSTLPPVEGKTGANTGKTK